LGLTDKRHARGKRYELALVLMFYILAKLAGEDHPCGIADWVRAHQAILCQLLQAPRPTGPSHNTYRRVLGEAVEVIELQVTVGHFLMQLPGAGYSVLVALDGKTLRGSIPVGQVRGIHLLAAYLPGEGLVLFQVLVSSQENEIRAAPIVLKHLDLRGKIVRGDALLTQRSLSIQIVEAGGEYVWLAKENQPQLLQDIAQLFQPEVCVPGFGPTPKDFRTARTTNKAHGRLEERRLTTSGLLRDYGDWPYLEQVFKLERRVIQLKTGQVRQTVVFGVTSLRPDEAGPERLLEINRDYWGIENGLHYRRDKTLREDSTRMSNPTLAEAIAILNNLVIGLAIHQGWRNLPQARRHYHANLQDALNLVLRHPT
jgi:predicted transposase YbfD/YdcC